MMKMSYTVDLGHQVFLSPSTDLESSQKQVESDRKAIDELVRERDILNKV